MKTCSKCGSICQDTQRFCSNCGNSLPDIDTRDRNNAAWSESKSPPSGSSSVNTQQPIYYPDNYSQSRNVNPLAVFALILGLVLLISPFIHTWRATGFLGASADASFIDTVFIDQDDRDDYDRLVKKGGWSAPQDRRTAMVFGYTAIVVYGFMLISYVLSIRAIVERKKRRRRRTRCETLLFSASQSDILLKSSLL